MPPSHIPTFAHEPPRAGHDRPLRIDVHCHIGLRALPPLTCERFSFEPAATYAPYDAYFSPRLNRSIGMRLGQWYYHQPINDDHALEAQLLDSLLSARTIDRFVVLAFDQYHTDAGEPLGARQSWRDMGTDLYVSNTYVRDLARRYPDRILFGASIHPYRRGVTEMLDEAAAAGAVLIKWLPLTQNIDPEDPRTVAFLRRAAALKMPLLMHFGGEVSLGNLHRRFEDPAGLLRTLRRLRDEGDMPPVIIAHAATPSAWPFGTGRYFRAAIDALRGDFADAPLYSDTAALAVISRAHWLKKLAALPELHHKLVYGSDFPVPPSPQAFRWRLRHHYSLITAPSSMIDRDVAIKLALGFGEAHLTRGWEILRPRLDIWEALLVEHRGGSSAV